MQKVRTRIAPSPTGSPHIGTAYAALFNYVFAKKNKGDFILRIEDTDRTRFVETSEKEITEALSWLGLEADESPEKGGKSGPYRQSERLEIYQKLAAELITKDQAYYCDCSAERLAKVREEQQARGEVPRYDRKCREEPPKNKENCVVRLAIPLNGETTFFDEIRGEIKFQNKDIDDQVLLKSDGFPTYHLASVVDDHLMEISHVIRAEEWLSSTPKHVLLYDSFGWEKPKFAHLPLLRNLDKSKISKRKNPVAVSFYREQGYLAEALVNFLSLMGWSMPEDKEIFTLKEMIEEFTFARIDPAGPVFDLVKLDWLNGHYIRELSDENLADRLVNEGFVEKTKKEETKRYLPLVKERMKKLSEFESLAAYYLNDEVDIQTEELIKISDHSKEETSEILEKIRQSLAPLEDWTQESIEELLNKEQTETGWDKTKLFQSIRYSVSGTKTTPPLGETLEAIGKNRVLTRLEVAVKKLTQ
ncbi:MAG TPA: glutamate--tRNA ligase [Candidatus Saccharimonadales bacterium]|nr:glutamate--tRNA ligase [Candidatus Saccharimonadales bacterium]